MGVIRSVESLALAILRLIGEEARKDRTAKVIAQLPVDVATYLMNEKRDWLNSIETRSEVDVILVPNRYLETPAYEIRRVRDDEADLPEFSAISHQMAVQPQIDLDAIAAEEKASPPPVPAVTTVIPSTPAPPPAPEPVATAVAPAAPMVVPQYGPRDGAFVRLWHWLFGDKRAPVPQAAATHDSQQERDRGRDRDRDRSRRDRDDRRGARDERRDARRDERGRDEKRTERRDGDRRPDRKEGDRRPERRDEPRAEQRSERRDERGRRPDQAQGGQRERRPEGQHRQPQPTRAEQPRPEPQAALVPPRGETAGGVAAEGPRGDQPERSEGERGERSGRRSRRGGRRRRREPGESSGFEPRGDAGGTVEGSQVPPQASDVAPIRETQPSANEATRLQTGSFDFERVPERVIVPVATETAALPVVRPPHDVQEWTPTPPSDATREAPRSEP
jgi:ribonuclease E